MAFTPTAWTDGTTAITATQLNRIETGIDDAHANDFVVEAKIADDAVTPAKTSFASDIGASGGIFSGRVNSNGTAGRVPSGWSVSRSSAGVYVLTHDFGAVSTYAPALTASGTELAIQLAFKSTNSFTVHTRDSAGTLTDTAWDFIVVRYA